jgi:pyruvate/2-oxoglutarate dehydrogenase complex dihydrolipoamide dehydrogenase (E3) component
LKGRIVVIGGGTIGSEMGLELAERGNTVYLVEVTDTLNAQGNMHYRIAIRQHMDKCPSLHRMTLTTCRGIEPNGVTIENKDGRQFIEADHIILATGMKARRDLANSFYALSRILL